MELAPTDPAPDDYAKRRESVAPARGARRVRPRVPLIIVPILALTVAMATSAGAQTFPGGGGPFAVGSVTSVSGSSVDLKSALDGSDVTVTLSDSTTYRKNQTAATDAISTGTCVRVLGTGSAAKGITATTVAITPTESSASSSSPGAGSGGCGGGPGFGGRTGPGGRNGSGPGANANRTPPRWANGRRRVGGIAFGSVVSISGDQMVVKARALAGRPKQGTTPKFKTENVKVTLAATTAITETVAGTASDVAVGKCLTATGTGDSTAVTATRVTISDPVNGACTGGFGGGFGGGPGGGGPGTGGPGAGGQATT